MDLTKTIDIIYLYHRRQRTRVKNCWWLLLHALYMHVSGYVRKHVRINSRPMYVKCMHAQFTHACAIVHAFKQITRIRYCVLLHMYVYVCSCGRRPTVVKFSDFSRIWDPPTRICGGPVVSKHESQFRSRLSNPRQGSNYVKISVRSAPLANTTDEVITDKFQTVDGKMRRAPRGLTIHLRMLGLSKWSRWHLTLMAASWQS